MTGGSVDIGSLVAILKVRDQLSEGIKPALASLRSLKDQIGNVVPGARGAQGALGSMGQSAAATATMLASATRAAIGFGSALLAMRGVSAVIRGFNDAVFGMNATLETSTLQFTTLMGDADRAREHVRMLFEVAKVTPFEAGPIIEASRLMQTFGGDALNTREHIIRVGDAAAATGAPIQELGFWVGRAVSMINAGKPFGEAALRLQELGVMSAPARFEMERLQAAGASSGEVFAVLTEDLDRFNGAMKAQAGTWAGVTSTFKDAVNILLADTFQPFFEVVRDGVGMLNQVFGSEGVEKAFKEMSANVRVSLGDSTVVARSFADGVLLMGQSVSFVAEVVYKSFT
jgi:hypothetical protein